MGKEEVLKILEKKRTATIKELAEDVGLTYSTVNVNVQGLVKEGKVEKKGQDVEGKGFPADVYSIKEGSR